MRFGLVRLAVVLAVFCLVANAGCYSQCVVSSCGLLSGDKPDQPEQACHHKKSNASNPTNPTKTSCAHGQLATGDWQKISSSSSLQSISQAVDLVLVIPASFSLSEFDFSGSAGSSPPSKANVVLITILRI